MEQNDVFDEISSNSRLLVKRRQFECAVGRVDGVESTQGSYWSKNTLGAVSDAMGTISRES